MQTRLELGLIQPLFPSLTPGLGIIPPCTHGELGKAPQRQRLSLVLAGEREFGRNCEGIGEYPELEGIIGSRQSRRSHSAPEGFVRSSSSSHHSHFQALFLREAIPFLDFCLYLGHFPGICLVFLLNLRGKLSFGIPGDPSAFPSACRNSQRREQDPADPPEGELRHPWVRADG